MTKMLSLGLRLSYLRRLLRHPQVAAHSVVIIHPEDCRDIGARLPDSAPRRIKSVMIGLGKVAKGDNLEGDIGVSTPSLSARSGD